MTPEIGDAVVYVDTPGTTYAATVTNDRGDGILDLELDPAETGGMDNAYGVDPDPTGTDPHSWHAAP